jgi:hypothetical protein
VGRLRNERTDDRFLSDLLRGARAAGQAAEVCLRQREHERHQISAAGRRRERELRVVSADHVTALVVTVEVALGLCDRRPEDVRNPSIELGAECRC